MQVETVKVNRDGPKGYHIINKSDFRPGVHEVYDAEKAAAEKAAAEKAAAEAEKAKGKK